MSDIRIGDEVYIHGFVDEVRKDVVIIKNEGGYFGTVADEIMPSARPDPCEKAHKALDDWWSWIDGYLRGDEQDD